MQKYTIALAESLILPLEAEDIASLEFSNTVRIRCCRRFKSTFRRFEPAG